MRARNIKPGLYKNEDLAECSVWARLIFPGLWMMADRAGRLEDRPKRIKAELLPFDSEDVDSLLAELARFGLIRRYEVDGQRLIWIPGFSKHRTPHIKEAKSEFPPHPEDVDSCLGSGENQIGTVQAPDKHQTSTNLGSGEHPLIPDSGFLIPDSSSPEEKDKKNINPELAEFVGTFQAYAIQLHGNTAPKITPSSTRQSEDCVDKLMRIDGFALADIRSAMRWAVKDTFWSPNARSLAQLRNKGKNGLTKFQSIYAAWKRETGGGDDDVPIGDMAALRAEAIRKYGPGAG